MAMLSAFDELVKQVEALDEQLRLAILNVSLVSPALWYTADYVSVAVPLTARLGLPAPIAYIPAMEVGVEFEKAG